MFNTKIRLLLIMTMLFSSILSHSAPAWGCSCVDPRPPQEAFVRADAVFVGKATGDGNTFWSRQQVRFVQFYHNFVPPLPHTLIAGLYDRVISFEVQESWQGVETTEITVRTGWGGGDCGYNFQQNQQYLVYAHQLHDGSFYASSCSRTAPLASAGQDLDYLQTVPKLELTYVLPMLNPLMLCIGLLLLSPIVLGIWRRRKPAKNKNR